AAVSNLEDFHHRQVYRVGVREPSYESEAPDRSKVKRVLLTRARSTGSCSPRRTERRTATNVAIVRIEQLYPIPPPPHRGDAGPLPERQRVLSGSRRSRRPRVRGRSSACSAGAAPRDGSRASSASPVARLSAPSSGSSKVHSRRAAGIIETAFSPTK
ncbi:multifunctional oxoglutarate decarboxylase/oxoglutarate dehydrogenase thiamine pyrophosphate-binding subunit/dihydrolipoyllysine-residue succinyltransferase subunit, partial [Rhodococcus hoagii]|nr:multifunctional oxoglutarate decarboxylase/oxoglutarate dehydrogenase thiamine pyrophosphate-binding subunit/dihydrolipoyllysine-residue succinyltransferase subunit [Prescottella equi]